MDMTKREFLTAVSNMDIDSIPSEENLRALAEYATMALEKMEIEAEKRKNHKSEKQKAEEAAKDAHAKEVATKYLTKEIRTSTDVMELMNADGGDYKVQAVSAILRRAERLGFADVQDVKIPKKGSQKGYTIAE